MRRHTDETIYDWSLREVEQVLAEHHEVGMITNAEGLHCRCGWSSPRLYDDELDGQAVQHHYDVHVAGVVLLALGIQPGFGDFHV